MTQKKRILFLTMVMIMSIFSFLTGCGRKEQPAPTIKEESSPLPLPEGVSLTGFYMTHQGMAAEPYYILRVTESGTYMKISNMSPDNYWMCKDEDMSAQAGNAKYLGFADTVKECEHASLVLLENEAPVRELEDALIQAGALGWDGYDETVSMENVADSGDSYVLYLELSDGSTVSAKGYNAHPAGFRELLTSVREIFEANSDYSRYMMQNFNDSPCTSLFVDIFDGLGRKTEYKLELMDSGNHWVVILKDPEGEILEKGIDIFDYGDAENNLPFDRFLQLMQKHHAERWNGYEKTDGASDTYFTIRLRFADGKEYSVHGSIYPEGFANFKEDFVQEIYRFYSEYTGIK